MPGVLDTSVVEGYPYADVVRVIHDSLIWPNHLLILA